MNLKFCVTLTTIPARLKDIGKTIETIRNQTLKPEKIFLNIPIKYYRFPNEIVDETLIEKIRSDDIEISRCNDYGPATKLMGSIKKIKEFDCVIIIDDDHLYHNKMCEIFINEFKKDMVNYSFYQNKIFDIKMAQCADGFLINTKFLDKIEKFYDKYVHKNLNLYLDDDLWFALYLQIIKKVNIKNIIDIFRNETGRELVYEVHSDKDALSKDIHNPKKFINRRKIAKIEYIKFKIKNFFFNN
jgi:hypothetical protein|tara:strand:- start:356 stop:1084 length:729 start_codon:yes stop_codon:yes gene_type:complete